jgi:ribulose kinase
LRTHHPPAGWPTGLLAKLGLSDLESKWPQRLLPLGAPVGRLTREAAAHTGLREGTLVAQGGADAFVGILVSHSARLSLLQQAGGPTRSRALLGLTDKA